MATAIELLVEGERNCEHVDRQVEAPRDPICGDCAAVVVEALLRRIAVLERKNHEHEQVRTEIATGLGLMRRQLEAAIEAGRADVARIMREAGSIEPLAEAPKSGE